MSARNVAVLALYNERREILLQCRSRNAGRLPNDWGFFGGGIEGQESPQEAVAREILEELEYRVGTPTLILSQKVGAHGEESMKYVFVERYDPGQPLIQHEGEAMKWWRWEEMNGLQISNHDRVALDKVREFLDSLP